MNTLFSDRGLGDEFRTRLARVEQRVDDVPKERFLATPERDLVEHFMQELGIETVQLFEDRAEIFPPKEIKIDVSRDGSRDIRDRTQPFYVPGIQVEVRIPFVGPVGVWKCTPSTWRSTFPFGTPVRSDEMGPGELRLTYAIVQDQEQEKVKAEHERNMGQIRFYLDQANKDIKAFKALLEESISAAISSRKERLKKTEGFAEMLGIPMVRGPGAPSVKPIVLERKLVRPLPAPPATGYAPEPGISAEAYAHILDVLRHEGRSFETTPATFAKHGEEDLRDIILAHLNGHYSGAATGETFRRSGKSDIRIEEENRAAFIAECKIWSGPKSVTAAVDQLLGYLTWRDCKAALVFFNTAVASFTSIQGKVPSILENHRWFKRAEPAQNFGEWRVVFQAGKDELREVKVHVFLFDLYLEKENEANHG